MRVTGARRCAVITSCIVMLGGAAFLCTGGTRGEAGATTRRSSVLGPGIVTVKIRIDRSHFSPSRIRVHPHTTVQFVVVNRDPIGHEFIIGDAEVHARHEGGHTPARARGGLDPTALDRDDHVRAARARCRRVRVPPTGPFPVRHGRRSRRRRLVIGTTR